MAVGASVGSGLGVGTNGGDGNGVGVADSVVAALLIGEEVGADTVDGAACEAVTVGADVECGVEPEQAGKIVRSMAMTASEMNLHSGRAQYAFI